MEKLIRISERNKFEVRSFLPNDDCIDKLANYFQNFSDGTRLKILSALCVKDLCVNDLAQILSINQTTLSHQLKILKNQNLVECRRDGKMLIYKVRADCGVNEILEFAVSFFCSP